jgi:hypothetical protein
MEAFWNGVTGTFKLFLLGAFGVATIMFMLGYAAG